MLRIAITMISISLVAAVLSACARAQTQSPVGETSSAVATPSVAYPPVRRDQCEYAIQKANQNLTFAKGHAHQEGVYVSWTQTDSTLADAVTAEKQQNYGLCAAKAHQVE